MKIRTPTHIDIINVASTVCVKIKKLNIKLFGRGFSASFECYKRRMDDTTTIEFETMLFQHPSDVHNIQMALNGRQKQVFVQTN